MVQSLTQEQLNFWDENGYLVLKGFYDVTREIVPIQEDVRRVMGLVRGHGGLRQAHGEFDEGLAEMARNCRDAAAVVYDAMKRLPTYVQLTASAKHGEIASHLLRSPFIGFAPRGYGIRLDHPGEGKFLTQLHQDYTSQLISPKGVVFWSPLRRVTKELGPVVLYPGSHRLGVQRIEKCGEGSYGLRLPNDDELRQQFTPVAPEPDVGDAVVIDFLLLHESSPNRSDRTRWAMICRYFDFTDPVGISHGWKGGLAEGNSFERIHPELTEWKS
ncbi:MAG: phytanoyl-CoA dioxygenase family protein [Acidobacteriota bacterium]